MMSSTKKISQQQLRQMMKERQQNKSTVSKENTSSAEEVAEDKRTDSPLASYDTAGRLSCILCNERIPSTSLWSQHISSKSHKNKIEEMKKKKMLLKSNPTKTDVNTPSTSLTKSEEVKPILKRKLETTDKQISSKVSKSSEDIKIEITNPLVTEDSSGKNSIMNDSEMTTVLPNDFFDNSDQVMDQTEPTTDSTEQIKDTKSETKSLPKGFFDDPVKDAKARKVVYKDPIEEQWEQFQKVMAEETNVSENIIVEDIEELQIDRNLEEVEEQIANWIKVNEMQKRAELLHNHIMNKRENGIKQEDSDSDVDEQDLNVFSNWRSRTALR